MPCLPLDRAMGARLPALPPVPNPRHDPTAPPPIPSAPTRAPPPLAMSGNYTGDNHIMDAGATELGKALQTNAALTHLNLECTGGDGA
jgi:hypothetical protein